MLPRKNSDAAERILRTRKWLIGAIACACLTGCMVGPNYHPIETKMPDAYVAAVSFETQKPTGDQGNQPVIDPSRWWEALHDEELNSLVERAIQGNLPLQIALDRMQEARMQEAIAFSLAMPVAGESAGGGVGTGSDLSRGRADNVMYSGDNSSIKEGKSTKKFDHISSVYGFDGGWDLDLFGKYRRAMEAAAVDTQAAIAVRDSALISLIADVVRAYIDMRALQMRLDVLIKNTEVAQGYYDLTKERFERGITNELDFTLAQRQVATLQAQQRPLVLQIQAAQYVIAILLGKFPEDIVQELQKPGTVPALPEKIDAGVPLELLRRRPGIMLAEREVAAATARIGVATANLFPRVVLLGAVGNETQGFVSASQAAFIWSFGPSINWALLDFGALDALVQIADLRAREALLNYKQVVINTVRDVDTSIGAYVAQQERLRDLGTALGASQRAVDLATQRYDRGLTDALNVIDAQRQEYELAASYVASLQTAADQFIVLYRSLGGGWERYQSFPPVHQPRPAVIAMFESLFHPSDPLKYPPDQSNVK